MMVAKILTFGIIFHIAGKERATSPPTECFMIFIAMLVQLLASDISCQADSFQQTDLTNIKVLYAS